MINKLSFKQFGILVLTLGLFFGSCHDTCQETRTYIKYTPIKKGIEEVRKSFEVLPTQALVKPGKIFTYGSRLYVVDRGTGFHVVDNSNPSSPVFTRFIKLDGCIDVAMQGGMVYANQGPDIVAIAMDGEPRIVNRGEQILSDLTGSDSIIIDWIAEEVTEVVETDCDNTNDRNWNGGWGVQDEAVVSSDVSFGNQTTASTTGNGQRTTSTSGNTGQSGSMARFSIVANNLYVVSNNVLSCFDLDQGFSLKSQTNIWNVETIFGTDEHLFLGSSTGMFIYDRNNGFEPTLISQLNHARGCDPVVVQGNVAFVTLRGNNNCGFAESGLYVVDISNIRNPQLHSMHPMDGPYGLAVRDDVLMICDGTSGLKVFDKSNLSTIGDSQIGGDASVNAYDVILQNELAILSAEDGVYQYSYDETGALNQLSTLIVK